MLTSKAWAYVWALYSSYKVTCECRLYSSAHFNDTFPGHTPPEILNTSLEGLVLLMKAMHVDKVSTSS